jgi:type VI secretion system protein ImpH
MEEMATHDRRTNDSLTERLFKAAHRFDFYQAVRLLEVLYPGKVPVGEGSEPEKEAVRFISNPSFEFPASAVSEVIRPKSDQGPAEMLVNFMGLAGTVGPLPAPYTELILQRARKNDTALRDFLNIFNHRLISLMYRIRKIHRICFDLKSPENTHFARYLFCLMGLGTGGLQGRMRIEDRSLLYYAALLNQHPRSIKGLELILSDYFGIRIHGEMLCGRWLAIEEDQTTRIGKTGRNRILGQSAGLGTRVWSQQVRLTIHIALPSLKQFLDFLPTGNAYVSLCELVRFYLGAEFEFDFLLDLKPQEVPGSRLEPGRGPRLGWTSWLKKRESIGKHGRVRICPWLIKNSDRGHATA